MDELAIAVLLLVRGVVPDVVVPLQMLVLGREAVKDWHPVVVVLVISAAVASRAWTTGATRREVGAQSAVSQQQLGADEDGTDADQPERVGCGGVSFWIAPQSASQRGGHEQSRDAVKLS